MRIAPRWMKVIRDLTMNPTRTGLVVMSIAIGVATIGMAQMTRTMLNRDLPALVLETRQPHLILQVSPFEEELLRVVGSLRTVREITARSTHNLNYEVSPGQWMSLRLYGLPDPGNPGLGLFEPLPGARYPEGRREVLLESSVAMMPGFSAGRTIHVETQTGEAYDLPLAGLARDIARFPSIYFNEAYGYASMDTIELLAGTGRYNELYILLAEGPYDEASLRAAALAISDRIEREGYIVLTTTVSTPGSHWTDISNEAWGAMMYAIGIFVLFLSSFLITNTLSAVLTQQVRQIGMMKSIGGGTGQVAGVFLAQALAYGLLGALLSIPLAAGLSWGFTGVYQAAGNIALRSFGWNWAAPLMQALIAVGVALGAALAPVLRGARIPAREALSDYGLGGSYLPDALDRFTDRLLAGFRWLSRPVRLALRNALRRKTRMLITLMTMTLAGMVFISMISLREQLMGSMDTMMGIFNFDLAVQMGQADRSTRALREAARVEGIDGAEGWYYAVGQVIHAEGSEGVEVTVLALPPDSPYIIAPISEGRWLTGEDAYAAVVQGNLFDEEPSLQVGSMLRIEVAGVESEWEIVGETMEIQDPSGRGAFVWVPYDVYARLAGVQGSTNYVVLDTDAETLAGHQAAQRRVQDHFQQVGMAVSGVMTIAQLKGMSVALVGIMSSVLIFMGVVMALVGGLGLAGTLSLNVIERTREIGVMRAVGADDGAIRRIVTVEGMLIGLVGGVLGAIAAIPGAYLFGTVMGLAFMGQPLEYRYSSVGVILWFGLALVVAWLASILPARAASRVSVNETLAYS